MFPKFVPTYLSALVLRNHLEALTQELFSDCASDCSVLWLFIVCIQAEDHLCSRLYWPQFSPLTNVLGGILLSLYSGSSVELPLDAGDLSPDLHNLLLLIRAWPTEVNWDMTLIKVLWFLYVVGLCLPQTSFNLHVTKPNSQKCLSSQ